MLTCTVTASLTNFHLSIIVKIKLQPKVSGPAGVCWVWPAALGPRPGAVNSCEPGSALIHTGVFLLKSFAYWVSQVGRRWEQEVAVLEHFLISGRGRFCGFVACCFPRLSRALGCDGRQLWINESSLEMSDPSCESGGDRTEPVGTGFLCDKGGCDPFYLRRL